MRVKGFVCATVVVGLCLVAPALATGLKPAAVVVTAAAAPKPGTVLTGVAATAPKPGTVAPSGPQRIAILKAFGAARAGWACMTVRLAASNHAYATVHPLRSKRCARWAFNGMNVIRRGARWRVLFEGSAFACPLSRIPRQVQRDLGVCP